MDLKQYITEEKLKEIDKLKKDLLKMLDMTDFDAETKKTYFDTIMEYEIVMQAFNSLYLKIDEMDNECKKLAEEYNSLPNGETKDQIANKHNEIMDNRNALAKFKMALMKKIDETKPKAESVLGLVDNRIKVLNSKKN